MIKIILIVVLALAARFAWGYYFSNGAKRPPTQTVMSYDNGIEKKSIGPMIMASVVLDGSHDRNMNSGFRILANYIFGGNTKRDSIAMTAPVTSTKTSESIAMTAPVTSTSQGESEVVSFVMPAKYTMETLPLANDDRISFEEKPIQEFYVWKFSGYAQENRAENQRQAFETALKEANLSYEGDFTLAQYNDPWTPPPMRLNEWWVAVAE